MARILNPYFPLRNGEVVSDPELLMVEVIRDPESLKEKPSRHMPGWLVVIPLIYLIFLVIIAIVYRKPIPNPTSPPSTILRTISIFGFPVPILVFWFGTLGGVVDSLQQIFAKNKRWNHTDTIWHVFAGVVGAAYGLASYLTLQVVVNASGSTSLTGGSTIKAEAIFALAAFTIGYEQSKFHEMMDDIFKIIFKPVTNPDDPKKAVSS